MVCRFFINQDGTPFDPIELAAMGATLEEYDDTDRLSFRNQNALSVAALHSQRKLVVSGPGTGKSTLFKQQILEWLSGAPQSTILAVSFVRKLVADLASDIQTDPTLTPAQKKQAEIRTLHTFARSIVERNHGSSSQVLQPHVRIIGAIWDDIVWEDVLSLAAQEDADTYGRPAATTQLHEAALINSPDWQLLWTTNNQLAGFYNAVGFADLIRRAREAIQDKPSLISHDFFIVDEYQDFNRAEELLLHDMIANSAGILVVGDDDQVLYETLKSGKASLIRALYHDTTWVTAMLPFCGRCNYHLVKAAAHFLSRLTDPARIRKVFLPMTRGTASEMVRAVLCAQPVTAVDYVSTFIDEHSAEIAQRTADLESGAKKDAFLLILSPSKRAKFFGAAAAALDKVLAPYRPQNRPISDDYFRVIAYYYSAGNPRDNYGFRKLLHYEGLTSPQAAILIRQALAQGKALADLGDAPVKATAAKAREVKAILDGTHTAQEKVAALGSVIAVLDETGLATDLTQRPVGVGAQEQENDEETEFHESALARLGAVEMLTIVGAKGLSADHVMIIGCDDVNMGYVTANAFYVAMTRARQSLHLLVTLGAGGAKAPHSYFDDLPDANVDFVTYRKTGHTLTALSGRRAFIEHIGKLGAMRHSSTKRRSP